VAVEPDGRLATITFDRPDNRNAHTPQTWRSLVRAANDLPGSVRVLVLRADGPSFSAGLDRSLLAAADADSADGLAAIARSDPATASRAIEGFQEAFGIAARPHWVSIALIQGHAVGAGFQLALSCDIRIAAEDAEFMMAEVALGLVPDLGGTKRLVELVGYARAASICLTGRPVSAAEAASIGLLSGLVPADQLAAAGDQFARQILALPAEAVAETKALLLAASGRTQVEQQRAEREAQYRQLRLLAGLDAED
jgi:enoyl-CoA hydratase/carnithine racemase